VSGGVPPYAELAAATSFSFLRGASQPCDMVARALELGHCGIGIADRNTVAGVVRAHVALREACEKALEEGLAPPAFRLLVGARLGFADDTPEIIAYPSTRFGWGRLTRLLTTGNLRAAKGDCVLHEGDLFAFLDDLQLIVLPPAHDALLGRLTRAAPDRVWLGATMLRQGSDARRLAGLCEQAARTGVPLIALNDALYAAPRCDDRDPREDHRAGRRAQARRQCRATSQSAGRNGPPVRRRTGSTDGNRRFHGGSDLHARPIAL
jgi:error-prone DNA polymerase